MTAVEDRLAALGDELDVGGDELVVDVMRRLDERPTASSGRRVALRVAAVLLLAVAAVVAAIPDARRTVAGWFGWEGVSVERRPDLDPPDTTSPFDRSAGVGEVVVDDGREILVSTVDGRFDVALVRKSVGSDSAVVETSVGGRPALWIDGGPHLMSFVAPDGSVIEERVAGNTLLWRDGTVTRRVEGFAELADAVEFAAEAFEPER